MSRDKKQEAILRKVLRRIAPHWILLASSIIPHRRSAGRKSFSRPAKTADSNRYRE